MKEKVAVYFRCSTDKQDKSIADQRIVLSDYAQNHAMIITTWIDKDEGLSGTTFEKRPDFMRMIRLVESGQNDFRKVLVYDVDRWGRPIDPDEAVYWEYHLKRFGVQVVYISDESINDNSLAGRLTKKIKQELATEESRKQSLRVRERSKMRAQEGFRVGGFAPYGFKRLLVTADKQPIGVLEHGERKSEKSQRVILTPGDQKEINIVCEIYSMKDSGLGVRAIVNNLNERKIPAPSARRIYSKKTPAKWSINSVWRILRNPIYKGDWLYNRQVRGTWAKNDEPGIHTRMQDKFVLATNTHAGIISEDLYNRVNSDFRPRGNLRKSGISYRSRYLLSGLIKCGNCGYNFHGHLRTSNGKKYAYYEDSGFNLHGKSTCVQTMIPKEKIERFILAELQRRANIIIDKDRLKGLIQDRIRGLFDPQNDPTGDIQNQIVDVNRRMENLKDSLEQGVNIRFVSDRLNGLECERKRLEKEKAEIGSRQMPLNNIEGVVEELLSLSDNAITSLSSDNPQIIKDGLRVFVDRVEVNPLNRKATIFVNKIPSLSITCEGILSVNECRRSKREHSRQKDYWLVTYAI
jgi:DNA invertase Pin-like site-specific DNA recombinase